MNNSSFAREGILLSYLPTLINLYFDGRNSIKDFTTTEICEKYIVPLTIAKKTTFCEKLLEDHHENSISIIQRANVFISHTWKYNFLSVIDTLSDHFSTQLLAANEGTPSKTFEEVVIWFDLFSNNQHKAMSLEFSWWCTTFKTAIEEMHHTVLILSPWQDPIPLTRVWCLFEIYCTAITTSVFEIAMNPFDYQQFSDVMLNNMTDRSSDAALSSSSGLISSEDVLDSIFGNINVERSEGTKPEDRDRIFELIRQTVSFLTINSIILEALRSWFVRKAFTLLSIVEKEMKETEGISQDALFLILKRKYNLFFLIALLYSYLNKHEKAYNFFQQCLNMKEALLENELSRDQLSSGLFLRLDLPLANCYKLTGRIQEYEAYLFQTLGERQSIYGQEHELSVLILYELGLYYLENEVVREKTTDYMLECYEIRNRVLGNENSQTLMALYALSQYDALKMNEFTKVASDVLIKKDLSIIYSSFSPTLNLSFSSINLTEINNLCILFAALLERGYQGGSADGKILLQKMQELYLIVEKQYGDYHPLTFKLLTKILKLVFNEGYSSEIKFLTHNSSSNQLFFLKFLQKQEFRLGHNHPEVIEYMKSLSTYYWSQYHLTKQEENFVESEKYLLEAIARIESELSGDEEGPAVKVSNEKDFKSVSLLSLKNLLAQTYVGFLYSYRHTPYIYQNGKYEKYLLACDQLLRECWKKYEKGFHQDSSEVEMIQNEFWAFRETYRDEESYIECEECMNAEIGGIGCEEGHLICYYWEYVPNCLPCSSRKRHECEGHRRY